MSTMTPAELVARNVERENSIILLNGMEQDAAAIRSRLESGRYITLQPDDGLNPAERIAIYAAELAKRGL